MPVPVFDQPVIREDKTDLPIAQKEKISGWVIFFSIILTSLLVVTIEFAFRDSNRLFNPNYQVCQLEAKKSPYPSFLGGKIIIPENCDQEKYESAKVIIHADFTVPLIVVSFLIYLLLRGRKFGGIAKVMFSSYYIFIGWTMIRIVAESERFLFKYHQLYGKYVILGTIIILVFILISLIQKKVSGVKVQ